jgi:acetyl-CoA C-acetyltransferase
MGVMSGMQHLVVGGGVESMSRVPINAEGANNDGNNIQLRKKVFQVPQGISADLIASIEGFSRQDVDSFALESQRRAARAQQANYFKKSLFPIRDPETGEVVLERDEHPRANTTLEGLAQLEPAFAALGLQMVGFNGETYDQLALQRYPEVQRIEHVHTAGNSSGIVDGAGAVLVASKEYIVGHGLKARARIRAMATIGSEPVIMLTAPAPVSRKALSQAGMTVRDIDLWEINEAFAAIPLQTIRSLELDPEKVNVNGGAIALGNPLGATGAILLGPVLDELERRNLTTALITLCIGGGQGIATIIERV